MKQKIIAYISVEVRDRQGRLISFQQKEANSLVANFINLLYVQASGASLGNVKEIGGVNKTATGHAYTFACYAATGVILSGIVVGTGTAAVTISDYCLGTRIAHGVASGQLNYLAQVIQVPALSGGTNSFLLTRGFTNTSGSTISVHETGIYCFISTTDTVMIDRTLMNFDITDGSTATVTYTIQVTV